MGGTCAAEGERVSNAAIIAGPAGHTTACVGIDLIVTGTTIGASDGTGNAIAVIDVGCTIWASETGSTLAGVASGSINTATTVLAWGGGDRTIIDLVFAEISSVTIASTEEVLAGTSGIRGARTLSAGTTVRTGIGRAPRAAGGLVLTTGGTAVTRIATARVSSKQVRAGTMIRTSVLEKRALIHVGLAEFSNKAEDAIAGRGLGVGIIRIINTNTTVLAGRRGNNTPVDDLAAGARVTSRALALGSEVATTKIDVQAGTIIQARVVLAGRRDFAGKTGEGTETSASNRGTAWGTSGTVEARVVRRASGNKTITKRS